LFISNCLSFSQNTELEIGGVRCAMVSQPREFRTWLFYNCKNLWIKVFSCINKDVSSVYLCPSWNWGSVVCLAKLILEVDSLSLVGFLTYNCTVTFYSKEEKKRCHVPIRCMLLSEWFTVDITIKNLTLYD
jgi:hypothetical protein